MTVNLSPFLQARFNIFLFLTFGWGLAKLYIFCLGRFYYFFNRQEKRVINNAVLDVVGRLNREINIRDLSKKVFRGIFSHYYEKLFIAFEKKEKATSFLNRSISCDDLEVIRRCLSKGKGVILITGHYGAIEYIPTLLAVNDFDISMIAKFKTKQLKDKVFSQAEKYKIRLIDAENSGNVLKAAIKELKQNRVLVTQCDEIEEWRPSERKKTSFLGKVTGLDRTINIIQRRTGAEVVFGVIHRINLNAYKLIAYSEEDMSRMLNSSSQLSAGEIVLKVLEQFIYYHPEQWYQWKKYPEIDNRSISSKKVEKPKASPFLQPVFEKIILID